MQHGLEDSLRALADLGDNWDGYGSISIKAQTLHNVRRILDALPDVHPEPDLVPNPHGTVSIEWDEEGDCPDMYLDLEVGISRVTMVAIRDIFPIPPQGSRTRTTVGWSGSVDDCVTRLHHLREAYVS